MAKLKLQIAHQVPGRIRLKIPSAKGNPDLLEEVKATFEALPGIDQITVNPVTGSVILQYDVDRHDEFHGGFQYHYNQAMPNGHKPPADKIDELARKISEEAEFLAEHSHAAKATVKFFKDVDREIKIASGNLIDLKILLAVGIVGFSIFEIGLTTATPIWVTVVIFGLNHFIEMHEPHAKPAAVPVSVS